MRYRFLAVPLLCAPALSVCMIVAPAYRDNGTHSGPCAEGGPDDVAQKFYDTQIQDRTQDPATPHPYLSDGLAQLLNDTRQDPANSKLLQTSPFSSSGTPADSTVTASASIIPNRDARNIPLRVELRQGA